MLPRLYARCCRLFVSCGAAQTITQTLAKHRSVMDMQELVQDWKISRQFTLEVADAMPAELYSFKPQSRGDELRRADNIGSPTISLHSSQAERDARFNRMFYTISNR